ncbi:hypothetical protein ACTXT7_004255 [Hymenolepis weldensis]
MFSEKLVPVPNCCRLRFPSTPITLVVEVLDSSSSSRHPKKRTIWRYSAEIAGLADLNSEISDCPGENSGIRKPALPQTRQEQQHILLLTLKLTNTDEIVDVRSTPSPFPLSQCLKIIVHYRTPVRTSRY